MLMLENVCTAGSDMFKAANKKGSINVLHMFKFTIKTNTNC